jgi:predicted DCC family thiol-disulfide oxidoreductase YuxK
MKVSILYDGECPVCRNYVRMMRLRESFGDVALADARERPDLVALYRAQGMEVNDGIVLDIDGTLHYGADAMSALAAISSSSRTFNRLNAALFSSPRVARALYPGLALGRRALLKLLGRDLIA